MTTRDEQLVEPSTSRGGQRTSHVDEEAAVPGGPARGDDDDGGGGGDDDDDDGGEPTPGETASSGSSKPYQRGPSSLPEPRPLPSRSPVIRPVGQT